MKPVKTEVMDTSPEQTKATRGPMSSAQQGLFRRTSKRLLSERSGAIGFSIIVLLIAVAVFASIISPYDPLEIGAGNPLSGPSTSHVFGTDDLGRDEFSRVVFGARISLTVSFASAVVALAVAIPLGLAAGYVGGWADAVVSRIFDTIFAFPAILVGIGLVAVLGTGIRNVVIAVAVINVPTLGRLMRVSILAQRSLQYVEAARALGASGSRVAVRHILPNALPPMVVQITIVMGEAVLLEAAFSFLGLGTKPPAPSWGTMLNEGRNFMAQAPWLGLFPGVAITLMILAINAFGDALRDALNPRRYR